MQQTLKTHFAINLNAYNKFYVNLSFKGLFWLWSDSRTVVLILHEYLNIYCIIINLGTHFEHQQAFTSHYAKKLSPFDKLCLNRAFKGLFWFRSVFSKVVLIPNVHLNLKFIIISLCDSFRPPICLENQFALKQSYYK